MKKIFLSLCLLLGAMSLMACDNEDESSSTITNGDKDDVTNTPSDNYNDNNNISTTMNICVNSHTLTVELAENKSVDALMDLLGKGPVTYTAHDYGNFEKVGNLGFSLPQTNESITTEPCDIVLYQGNSICIFYGPNSWSYTKIGKITGVDKDELKSILGDGEVEIRLSR